MGRLKESTTPSNYPGQSQLQTPNQQPEEYQYGHETRARETSDIVSEEYQQENYQNEPTKTTFENQDNIFQEKPRRPPPTNGAQAVQFPPQGTRNQGTRSHIPSNSTPQAFPPPEAYPPEKQAGYPPPQPFPPPPGNEYIHSFPHQGEPVNFPPREQAFQQPDMAQFTPPVMKYSYTPANMNAMTMSSQGIPAAGSPFGHGIPVTNTPGFNPPTEQWKSGLFDCMDDPENAIITACFPCVTFGQIAEIIDQGRTTCTTSGCLYGMIAFCIAAPCLISCGYRTKLRTQVGLVETPGPDWLVHCFCEWCALCQEYRELKGRGIDPAIGWQGNAMQQQMATMTPPMHSMMGR